MDAKMIDQIKEQLSPKSTEELVEIWSKNDHLEWSDAAFSAIEELLRERGVEPPSQTPRDLKKERERIRAEYMSGWDVLNRNPLGWKGRIGRLDWLWSGFVPLCVLTAGVMMLDLRAVPKFISPDFLQVFMWVMVYMLFVNTAKRCRDFKRSGQWWIGLMVPFINFIVILHCLFQRGTWEDGH